MLVRGRCPRLRFVAAFQAEEFEAQCRINAELRRGAGCGPRGLLFVRFGLKLFGQSLGFGTLAAPERLRLRRSAATRVGIRPRTVESVGVEASAPQRGVNERTVQGLIPGAGHEIAR